MPNAIDLTGQRFGKLKVIDRMGKSLSGAWRWNVICDCGVRTIRQSGQLKRIKSCGCITGYNAAIALGREIHGMSQSPEFGVWYGMKVRCGFTGQKGHKNYVGRVSICPEWRRSFSASAGMPALMHSTQIWGRVLPKITALIELTMTGIMSLIIADGLCLRPKPITGETLFL